MEFMFSPIEFVNNLKYMGLGLLGTFLIIGIIMIFSLFSRILFL